MSILVSLVQNLTTSLSASFKGDAQNAYQVFEIQSDEHGMEQNEKSLSFVPDLRKTRHADDSLHFTATNMSPSLPPLVMKIVCPHSLIYWYNWLVTCVQDFTFMDIYLACWSYPVSLHLTEYLPTWLFHAVCKLASPTRGWGVGPFISFISLAHG